MLSDIPKIKQNRVLASGPLKIQDSLCGGTKLNNLVSVSVTGIFEALHSPNSALQESGLQNSEVTGGRDRQGRGQHRSPRPLGFCYQQPDVDKGCTLLVLVKPGPR